MSFHEILIGIMAVFALLGGIDRILGSRFGLGPRFEEGILAMGTLGLAMIGIVCLAPVLARLLRPIVVPVYGFLGADPAMFAGTLLPATWRRFPGPGAGFEPGGGGTGRHSHRLHAGGHRGLHHSRGHGPAAAGGPAAHGQGNPCAASLPFPWAFWREA